MVNCHKSEGWLPSGVFSIFGRLALVLKHLITGIVSYASERIGGVLHNLSM